MYFLFYWNGGCMVIKWEKRDKIGSYELVEKLGEGAYGEVWKAKQPDKVVAPHVAIKIAKPEKVSEQQITEEAKVWLEASNHPNILTFIEAHLYTTKNGEQLCIISKYIEEGSLEEWIELYSGQKQYLEEAVKILCGILEGLEYLGAKKIVHRDLKPSNILLYKNLPLIADFGFAKILQNSMRSRNRAGTPDYMAPEAFYGVRNAQTDIYSVGVISYRMLSGQLPFSVSDRVQNRLHPRAMSKYIPKDLQHVIFKALEKDPSVRYQSAQEMLIALRAALISEESTKETIFSTESTLSISPKAFKRYPVPSQNYAISFFGVLLFTLITLAGAVITIKQSYFDLANTATNAITILNESTIESRYCELRMAFLDHYSPAESFRGASTTNPKLEALVASLKAKTQLDPSPKNMQALGCAEILTGNYNDAVKDLLKASVELPRDISIRIDLSVAYSLIGNLDAALNELTLANSADPSNDVVLFNLALIHSRLKRYDAAKAEWQRYLALDPKSRWSEEAKNNLVIIDGKSIE